jgi:hypothetical protein
MYAVTKRAQILYLRRQIKRFAHMEDQELLKKLAELENKQWADKALAEIRNQKDDYEYQIVSKTEETGFVSAIAEFSSAGYTIIPDTTLLQNEIFIVLMKRDKSDKAK